MSLTAGLISLREILVLAAPPNPGLGTEPPGIGADVTTLIAWVAWCAVAACVAGLLIAAAKAAIARRHQEEFDFGGVAKPLIAVGIIGAAGVLVSAIVS